MGKKLKILGGVFAAFIGICVLVAAFGPRDDSGQLEYIGGPPPQINSSFGEGMTTHEFIASKQQQEKEHQDQQPSNNENNLQSVSTTEEPESSTSDSSSSNLAPVSDYDRVTYFMDSLVSSCNEQPDTYCDSELKRNYDFYCGTSYGDLLVDTCTKVSDYLTSRGVI